MNYDIIGDIHGHAEPLELLLQKLGYNRKAGVYSHPDKRKVIFVGDFVDRGPKIREVLRLVKDMCESGNAEAIMGNHEFNAICFHTPHVEKGGFFRNHSAKEIEQHFETLKQFKRFDSEWADFLEWFKKLPLYLEYEDFRVVHACWDDKNIDWLKQNYKGISSSFLAQATDKNANIIYSIVDETLKGKEDRLPNGITFTDKDGAIRTECRVKWWSDSGKWKTLKDVLIDCPPEIADNEIPGQSEYYSYKNKKPVFFGHYWLKGTPVIEYPNAICLDYSVAKGGKLVACRLEKNKTGLIKKLLY